MLSTEIMSGLRDVQKLRFEMEKFSRKNMQTSSRETLEVADAGFQAE
jgi:hypothetical protein